MIELKNVKMCFEDFNALDGVDLTIDAGTAFGLLGSNGAGKSTFLRCLNLLETPIREAIAVIRTKGDMKLSKAILDTCLGFGPVTAKEAAYCEMAVPPWPGSPAAAVC